MSSPVMAPACPCRCDCAPTEEDAKRCFILPFDRMVSAPSQTFVGAGACHWATLVLSRSVRLGQVGFTTALTGLVVQAFLEASMKSDAELLQWFNDRLVWNSPTVVNELLRNGLFVREFAPQVSQGCGSCRCPSS